MSFAVTFSCIERERRRKRGRGRRPTREGESGGEKKEKSVIERTGRAFPRAATTTVDQQLSGKLTMTHDRAYVAQPLSDSLSFCWISTYLHRVCSSVHGIGKTFSRTTSRGRYTSSPSPKKRGWNTRRTERFSSMTPSVSWMLGEGGRGCRSKNGG